MVNGSKVSKKALFATWGSCLFLVQLFFDNEDGGGMFLQTVKGLSENYKALAEFFITNAARKSNLAI
jgi:hypothetical protein